MSDTDKKTGASVPAASRIGRLATLPLFFKLDGKRVVLAGGGEAALWKAELLAATGAQVDVFSELFAEGFQGLASAPPNGRIVLNHRRWTPNDLMSAAIAVGAITDEAEGAAFASAARAAGVPVNVVDRPALCDFQFGAIVNRSPLVVGISTDGASPVFGQAIRSLMEGLLPDSFRLWAESARALRRDGDRLGDTAGQKRRFWQRFADLAIRHSDRGPTDAELDQLIADAPHEAGGQSIVIIDIGAGGADALTLGAVRVLRSADDIFFDEGVPTAVTDFARREARRYPVAGDCSIALDGIAQAAAKCARVVRIRMQNALDAGGRVDEADGLRAAGLSVVVVPPGYAP
jgi:uroporphyrin-III C-methyltransferase / precorrin-2 dehydrogenase / sirohydrochlorin ferrochelatase